MGPILEIFLPISMAIIMFSLGLGLTFDDFRRIFVRPKAFLIGAFSQMIVLPIVVYGIVIAFGFSGQIAVGFMLLSACAGGMSSNMISGLSGGDVALSVSLTAVLSLVGIFTVPVLTYWSVIHFMQQEAPEVSIIGLSVGVFFLVTFPVVIGLLLHEFKPGLVGRISGFVSKLAMVLFLAVIVIALGSNWSLFLSNLAELGVSLVTMNALLMFIGLGIAAVGRLPWAEIKTISIETGLQNATLGIALAGLVSGQTIGISAMALPSAVYGVLCFLLVIPFIFWFRRV